MNDTSNKFQPLLLPITVVSKVSTTWYFAEGYTGGNFTEYLALANPNNTSADVTVTYYREHTTTVVKHYSVNGNARATLNINNEAGSGQEVSMTVTSTVSIVAERPMYFIYSGGTTDGSHCFSYQP